VNRYRRQRSWTDASVTLWPRGRPEPRAARTTRAQARRASEGRSMRCSRVCDASRDSREYRPGGSPRAVRTIGPARPWRFLNTGLRQAFGFFRAHQEHQRGSGRSVRRDGGRPVGAVKTRSLKGPKSSRYTRSSRPFRSDGIREGLAGATPRPPRRGRGTTARAERKPDRIGGG
jgi:hypothetical protein